MIKAFKVNIDYELELFEKRNKPSINKELEYAYFLTQEDTPLFNQIDYTDSYLKKLESYNFNIPSFTKEVSNVGNWWGKLKNIELEQSLNDKLTSLEVSQKLEFLATKYSKTVTSNEEIQNHICNKEIDKWILKDPHYFSGMGFKSFSNKETIHFDISKKNILEPWFKRSLDIGTTVINSNFFHYVNLVDEKGAYKGTFCSRDNLDSAVPIELDFENLKDSLVKVKNQYDKLGAIGTYSIDSFFYVNNDSFFCYPLVEVNYRKTVGLITLKLREHFDCDYLFFGFFPAKLLKELNNDFLILSPESSHFSSVIFKGNTKEQLLKELVKFQSKLKRKVNYLDKFIIYIQGLI